MTTDQAAAIWPVMKAFSEGKKVQSQRNDVAPWDDMEGEPLFSPQFKWRIKPELFELRCLIFADGIPCIVGKDFQLSDEFARDGARIVTLREIEEK